MEILGHIVTGPTVRPLPTTTEGWLIQISADVAAMGISLAATNEKIDRLIDGAIHFDGRLDKVETWRARVEDDVAQVPKLLDWQKAMDTRFTGIKLSASFLAGVIGAICGAIGAAVVVVTGVAQAFGGRHP